MSTHHRADITETENTPRKMLSERQILDLLPIARSTLQQWEKDGDFSQGGDDWSEPQGMVR